MKILAAAWRQLPLNSGGCLLMLTLVALMSVPSCRRDRLSTTPVLDSTLPQARGGIFRLRAAHSQPVLLAFLQTVPDTADTPSRQQVAFLRSMNHQYSACGLKVVIVDASGLVAREPPKHDALINASYDWQLDIPLLEDEGNQVAQSWGINRLPTLVLLRPDGNVAQRWHGMTGPATLAQGIEKVCAEPSGRLGNVAP